MLTIHVKKEIVQWLTSEDKALSHYSTQALVAIAVNTLLNSSNN